MKNKLIKIGLLSLLSMGTILSLNSCRDAINIEQDGEVNDKVFFSSVSNMQKYLQGDVYNSVSSTNEIYASSLFTDEVSVGYANGGAGINDFRHVIDNSNGLASSIWLSNYTVINNVNRLLKGAENITPSAGEVATYNKILAEARALRAFAYLQLQTYFSEDMANDNALGVMIINDVPTPSTKTPRSKNADVYAVMNADLDFAELHLPQSSRYYVSKDFVNAVRARLNLYRGRYTDAKTYAQAVISGSGLTLTPALPVPAGTVGSPAWNTDFYKEASTSPYRQMWSDNTQGEVIFALSRPTTGSFGNIGSVYNTNSSDVTGSTQWEMGRNLFNILDATNGDIRRYAYIDPTSTPSATYVTDTDRTLDKLVIDKYPGKSTYKTRNDIKVFRISEMYFILAEAEAAAGNFGAARNYIQQVRVARNYLGAATTPIYGSLQDALKDILKERRVELAFEGHRFIDLKRLAARAGVTMDRNNTDERYGITPENLSNGSYKYTLPIPSAEIAGNPGIQQNSGY